MGLNVARGRFAKQASEKAVFEPNEMVDNRFGGDGYQLILHNMSDIQQVVVPKLKIGKEAFHLPSLKLDPGDTGILQGIAMGNGDKLTMYVMPAGDANETYEGEVEYLLQPGGSLNVEIAIYDRDGMAKGK